MGRHGLRTISLATMLPAFGGLEIPWLPSIEYARMGSDAGMNDN